MKEELIKQLKQINVIRKGYVKLKFAESSDFYVDIKKAYGHPEILDLICNNLWEIIDKKATCIATSGHGGISPATILSSKYNLKLTLVRDKPKEHGRDTLIDGYMPTKEDKVIVIDDVFTTGGSLKNIINIIKTTEAKILGCYVVVKRSDLDFELPLSYILKINDLL